MSASKELTFHDFDVYFQNIRNTPATKDRMIT